MACKIVFASFRIAWTNITSRWSVSGLYRGGIVVCYGDYFVLGSFYLVFYHSCPSCVAVIDCPHMKSWLTPSEQNRRQSRMSGDVPIMRSLSDLSLFVSSTGPFSFPPDFGSGACYFLAARREGVVDDECFGTVPCGGRNLDEARWKKRTRFFSLDGGVTEYRGPCAPWLMQFNHADNQPH